jgi:hypothetical protein
MIPITDTPKKIPITLSDTHYRHTQKDTHYTEWYPSHWVIPTPWVIFSSHRQFSQPTLEFTHYTEGPCFPPKQTGHRVIPVTLRDTRDTEWYPLPWVLRANRILDGRTDGQTHRFWTAKNPIFLYKQIHVITYNIQFLYRQQSGLYDLQLVCTI